MDARTGLAIVCSAGLVAGIPPGAAAATFSGQVSAGSDLFFRGLRQNNGPSLSARGLETFDGGHYAGAILANDRSVGDARLDGFVGTGFSAVLAGRLPYHLDLGVGGAVFAGGRGGAFHGNPDYGELYGSLSAGPARLSASLSPDYFSLGAPAYRLAATLHLPVPARLRIDVEGAWNGGAGVRRYVAIRTGRTSSQTYADLGLHLSLPIVACGWLDLQVAGTSLRGAHGPYGLIALRYDF